MIVENELGFNKDFCWSSHINSQNNFITNLRYDSQKDIFILIHQNPLLQIIFGEDALKTYGKNSNQQDKYRLRLQSNIYDGMIIKDKLIVSNRGMPVRIYNLESDQGEKTLNWGTFADKKANSELYLSPYQFANYGDVIIGGGKKFLSIYDCNKMNVSRRLKEMYKRHTSSVELLDQNTIIAGQFEGQLTMLDIRQQQSCETLKPHVDFVTRIKRNPSNSNQFITLARKDNYSYLWDKRSMQTFLCCYEMPLYGNQRTGFDFSEDGSLVYFGDEQGKIHVKSVQNGETILTHKAEISDCVGGICSIPNGFAYAVGSRSFPLPPNRPSPSLIGLMKLKR